jgi:hypothetical protein
MIENKRAVQVYFYIDNNTLIFYASFMLIKASNALKLEYSKFFGGMA